jgi:hypothetical protein
MHKRFSLIFNITALILLSGFYSCKKLDYDNSFKTFANIYFLDNVALNRTGQGIFLSVKYEGSPVAWTQGTGRIEVPEGKGRFEFFDRRTGVVLAEKTVEVNRSKPDTFLVFQPTVESPIAFLDLKGQANEAAPPAGFIKLKVANYATDLIPYEQTDIIVVGINMNFELTNLDTIEAVGNNLSNETFHLVPTTSDILAYTFCFKKHGTDMIVRNDMGDVYMNIEEFLYPDDMNPKPEKNIYTLYFVPILSPTPSDMYVKHGGKYYNIRTNILYAN